ncbi:DUF1064 domain-containing protein [Nosocomiicoccus sp. HMSC059G07]|uniref:DUF1064 domain-containing protein n=1 Tax=Nosocomiicoccus sp. HMSC059G07 TaxID=1739531 RepID=UPI0008C1F969|nr:DUF1064 domain-containing protein [Nosocomiicoccus sp. HMSC059G07]OFO55644.1 hypothetical protein HMPREF3029_03460 [Nosocomiicoccus sp. HMSC059G07]
MITIRRLSKHKYNARKIEVDGIRFDSKAEADYYLYLKYLQSINEVRSFYLQPVINLLPSFKYNGKTIRKMDYRLDFKVEYMDGKIEYIDVKGMATTDAKMKLKIARYLNQDKTIKWISRSYKHGDDFGWVEYDELQRKRRLEKRRQRVD